MQKSILITGCSSGIGLACASELQRRGYQVLATCRKDEDVQRLQQQGFCALRLDLDDAASVQQVAAQVLHLTDNHLYALFNNAGYGVYGRLLSISRQQLEQQFSGNFFAVHQLTMLLLPAMLANGAGRIIINSSIAGRISTPGRGAYSASKYALEAWADALRRELFASGVQVSLIEPGPIATRFSDNVQQGQPDQPVLNSDLVGRFTLPVEAVVKKVCHALESQRAKPRYPVTLIAHAGILLNRLLPDRIMDRLMGTMMR